MAEKKQTTIVIKKITIAGGGHHGGSWKVAFADFMTAMMCFFLVMWLLNSTPQVRQQVASYFSGPSMLEHDFTSYGAELTLEKLFLDLVNEPLKTLQTFLEPADFTPNIMAMGSRKIILHHVATELGAIATNVSVESDKIELEIPERYLFLPGTSDPSVQFVSVMDKVKGLTLGLEDSVVDVESVVFSQSMETGDQMESQKVASQRKDLVVAKIRSSLEHQTVDVVGRGNVQTRVESGRRPEGYIRLTVSQKQLLSDGSKPRKIESFSGRDESKDVYSDFVRRVSGGSQKKEKTPSRKR